MAAKRMTKSQIISELADRAGVSKKDVNTVFEEMRNIIKRELGRRGPGEFTVPDLLKLKVTTKKAEKGGEEKTNPFTGEKYITKPKPAQKKVKATPLKKLKDLVQ